MNFLIPTIILGALSAWLAWRLIMMRRSARRLAEAAERGDPLLAERMDGLGRLARALNRLVEERIDISDTGRGHLERIRTTLENLREAVVMVDRDNRIRMANPAFTELAGIAHSPLGQRVDLLLGGAEFREFMDAVRQGGVGERREIVVRQMKRERWLEASAANLPDTPHENGPLILLFLHDVTRQKRLENMRTEFVANLSHELRTPVTIIKGYAETLLEDEAVLSREERVRFLEKIRAGADRQNRLLEDLLLLSRLESADMSMEMEVLCLEELLAEVVSSWKPLVEQHGRAIDCRLEPGRSMVRADPFRLRQVMDNLFENVLRHAAGFTCIVIGTEAVEGKGVRIVVEDDGPGIPDKDRPHIFQRFYRVEKGRSREQGGTGLGLSIVKHLVSRHGGTISAAARAGGGTRMEILLPTVEEKPAGSA